MKLLMSCDRIFLTMKMLNFRTFIKISNLLMIKKRTHPRTLALPTC